jgi:prepilin-type N-terminal cleavage/methylation domain-containing protein
MATPCLNQHVENQNAIFRQGLSLIEVMIAVTVLTVTLLSIIGHQYTLNNLRSQSLKRALRTVAVNNLVNLVDGSNWDELGRAERPWSMSRLQAGGSTNSPFQLTDLVGLGIVSVETGHFKGGTPVDPASGDLRFYVEYYRSTANTDSSLNPIPTQPGLLDAQQTSPSGFRSAFASTAAACRILPNPNLGLVDGTQITAGNPVLVRLAVTEVDPDTGTQRQVYESFLGVQTAP